MRPILIHCLLWSLVTVAFINCVSDPTASHLTWSVYKGDAASSSYSALRQINHESVHRLEVAWEHSFKDVEPGQSFGKYECNPIVVGDIMYCTSPRSWAYALDARTGEEIWSFDPFDGARGGGMKRGVTYWERSNVRRILFTASNFLYSLNAVDGKPDPDFGDNGRVNLNEGLGVNPDSVWVRPTSPGMIYQDLIIMGSEVAEIHGAAPGHIRAYDVRTGNIAWIFHTIPQPGEFGYDTWPADAWKYVGGANNWGGMSLDQKAGIVYAPLGSPTYDFYGADRPGMNLFGNSLVALDAATGERKWHFQTTHHDVWDYDLPAPPSLIDLGNIPAVSLVTKTGFIFLFNRLDGTPLFPIDEKPMPSTDMPGEEVWPTQPIPRLPAPFVRQQIDSSGFESIPDSLRTMAMQRFRELAFEGLYTPPSRQGTLMLPGTRGGAEWGGSAVDPATGVLYINGNESPEIMTMQPAWGEKDGRDQLSRGHRLYLSHCALCHGGERQGRVPNFPDLLALPDKYSKTSTTQIIQQGQGRMPAFSHLSDRAIQSLVDFLYATESAEAKADENEDAEVSKDGYRNVSAYSFFRDAEGYPAIDPPWGTLNAVDLRTGTYLWKTPLGNFPERQQVGGPETGTENWGGPLVTAGGLVFIAATQDAYFRAFDKETGQLVWQYELPGFGYATPATYEIAGKQFMSISVTRNDAEGTSSILTFSLD